MQLINLDNSYKESIWSIYKACRRKLDSLGIHQWTDLYPNTKLIEENINKDEIYGLVESNILVGVVSLENKQPEKYAYINWLYKSENVCVITRLAVDPKYQNKGYAKALLRLSEIKAFELGYDVIRLDSNSDNERNKRFYLNAEYILCDEMLPKDHKESYNYCFEKKLK